MPAEYQNALWLPMQHFGFAVPFTPRYVILHATAGDQTPQAVQQTCDERGTSVHFSIGMDGTIAQHVPLDQAAYGNGVISAGADPWWFGNPNNYTISIEHCKPDTANASELTLAQRAASFALVGWLCSRFDIPRRAADAAGGITGHYSIDPVNRARCPGAYPWHDLYATLNSGNGGPAMGWTHNQDGTATDTLGHQAGTGFAAEIQARGITANAFMNETYVNLPGVASFLPLQSGDVLLWDGQTVSHNGALVSVRLYEALQAAEHPAQNGDPAAEQKLAAIKQIVEG